MPRQALDALPGSQGVLDALNGLIAAVDAAKGVHGCLVPPMAAQGAQLLGTGLMVMIAEEASRLGVPNPMSALLGQISRPTAPVVPSPIPAAFRNINPESD